MAAFVAGHAFTLPDDELPTDTLVIDKRDEWDIPVISISIDDLEGERLLQRSLLFYTSAVRTSTNCLTSSMVL